MTHRFGWREPKFVRILVLAAFNGAMLAYSLRFLHLGHPILFPIAILAPWLLVGSGLLVVAHFRRVRSPGIIALAILLTATLAWDSVISGVGTNCGNAGSQEDALTFYSHNVHWGHGDPTDEAKQVNELQPDVVILQEADQAYVDTLLQTLDASYEFVVTSEATQTLSLAIVSRLPLTDPSEVGAADGLENPSLGATVTTDDGDTIRLLNVHLSAPTNGGHLERRKREYATIEALSGSTDLIAGDFNSSRAHRRFRQASSGLYEDAHKVGGCGPTATWSPLPIGPPLLHLDHVLVGGDLAVLDSSLGDRNGSDHRAVLTAVSVRESTTS